MPGRALPELLQISVLCSLPGTITNRSTSWCHSSRPALWSRGHSTLCSALLCAEWGHSGPGHPAHFPPGASSVFQETCAWCCQHQPLASRAEFCSLTYGLVKYSPLLPASSPSSLTIRFRSVTSKEFNLDLAEVRTWLVVSPNTDWFPPAPSTGLKNTCISIDSHAHQGTLQSFPAHLWVNRQKTTGTRAESVLFHFCAPHDLHLRRSTRAGQRAQAWRSRSRHPCCRWTRLHRGAGHRLHSLQSALGGKSLSSFETRGNAV